MSLSTLFVDVVPSVMKWLRESMELEIEEVGKAIEVPAEIIVRWETGEKRPTLNDLLKLADVYKRPVSAFYLPYPMKEPASPTDYRRFSQKEKRISPNDLHLIRKAQFLQETSNELIDELEENLNPTITSIFLSDDPEYVAKFERNNSCVTIDEQKKWLSHYEAFNKWKEVLERKNILVFQFSFEGKNIRGLLLKEIKPYIIVLNSKEDIRARIFTLMHEYAHALLTESKSALCYPENEPISGNKSEEIMERWCDNFSGSFLMPKDTYLTDFSLLENNASYENIRWLSNKYHVSKPAALTRLFILKAISWSQYENRREDIFSRSFKVQDHTGGKGETKAETAVREKGQIFCSIVIKSNNRNIISTKDVLDYLDIKLNNFNELKKNLACNA